MLRVLTGPRLSPLALLVTRVIVPRLDVEPRWVPGPPKRFAQGIGATLTVGALVAWLAGAAGLAAVLVALVVVAATLESVLAICLGCRIFALLMRAGIIPPEVCLACSDLSGRLAAATPRPVPRRASSSDRLPVLRRRRRQLPFVDQCQASPGRLWKPKLGALDRIQP